MSKKDDAYECPKCGAVSGDDWTQCHDICAVEGSPYYNKDWKTLIAMTREPEAKSEPEPEPEPKDDCPF